MSVQDELGRIWHNSACQRKAMHAVCKAAAHGLRCSSVGLSVRCAECARMAGSAEEEHLGKPERCIQRNGGSCSVWYSTTTKL